MIGILQELEGEGGEGGRQALSEHKMSDSPPWLSTAGLSPTFPRAGGSPGIDARSRGCGKTSLLVP